MVKRLRRSPLKAQSRVRFPAGSPDEGYKNTPKEKSIYRLLFLLRFVRFRSRFRRCRRGSRGKSNSITAPLSARLSSGITLSFYRRKAQRDKLKRAYITAFFIAFAPLRRPCGLRLKNFVVRFRIVP